MGLGAGLKSLGAKASSKLVNAGTMVTGSRFGKHISKYGKSYSAGGGGLVGAGAAMLGQRFQNRLKKKFKVKRVKGGKRRYKGK